MRVLLLLFVAVFVIACNKQVDTIGSSTATGNPYLLQLDSFQAQAIIYRPDSFKTSSRAYLQLGHHKDPVFGDITCTPFFRLSIPALPELTNASIYDSVAFMFKPNKAYYGDTMSVTNVSLHEMKQEFTNDDNNNFYNNQSFAYSGTALGSTSYINRPNGGDSVRITVNNSLGSELFNMIRTNAAAIKDSALFATRFKGFALQVNSGNVIYNVPIGDSTIMLRIYYHDDVGKPQSKRIDFKIGSRQYAFTSFKINRAGTPLAQLDASKEMAAASYFVDQPLTGIHTRIAFPTAKEIQKLGSYVKIVNATFLVKPVVTYYGVNYPFPQTLNAYEYTFATTLSGPIAVPGTETNQSGDFLLDNAYGKDTRYTFDITSYIETEQTATSYTTTKLVIRVPDEDASIHNLVAGSPTNTQYPSSLKISLLVYNDQ